MTRRDLVLLTGLLALLLSLVAARLRGPAVLPDHAPPDRFSAARAIAVLKDLLREEIPHPVGTAANRRIRQRIEAQFRAHGYAVEVHRAFVCNAAPACAPVENVLAMKPGDPGPWVLLTAHYDSVAAGPGASDDGVGVAALLEVARALTAEPGIAFLITDGEEAGLLGAEAFVTSSWRHRVSAVVNVESRGTSGPSFLFETSKGNLGLIEAIRSIPRPAASSLFYTIYEQLPNDTDVTVFKRAGLQAMNFAAVDGAVWYHTPLDDLAHVQPRTVQHHGDNLLAVARALKRPLAPARSNAVFFDVLNLGVMAWPEGWTPWMAIGSLMVMLAAARGESWRGMAAGAILSVSSVLAATAVAMALVSMSHLRAGHLERIAYPQPAIASMWMTGGAVSLFLFGMARQSERRALLAGAGLVWHAMAMLLALSLPGTAYLALVPAIGSTAALIVRARPLLSASVAAVAAGLVLFPPALFLYAALGKGSLAPMAVISAFIGTTIAPLVQASVRRLTLGFIVLATLLAALTPLFPAVTRAKPARQPIEHELSTPTVTASVRRENDGVTLVVGSRRAADRLMVDFPRPITVLRVNGIAPAAPNPRSGRPLRATIYGREATIELRATGPLELTVSDLTYGLPASAAPQARAREAAGAVTSHRGDVTISRTKISL